MACREKFSSADLIAGDGCPLPPRRDWIGAAGKLRGKGGGAAEGLHRLVSKLGCSVMYAHRTAMPVEIWACPIHRTEARKSTACAVADMIHPRRREGGHRVIRVITSRSTLIL